ncbi:MAG: RNA polymerase sigma factor [Chloroflexota bacterium]
MSQTNSRDVVTGFIVDNRNSIYRLAYSYVRNKEDALDIVQDSIYKALSSTKSLNNPAVIKPWFYRIVVNTAIDHLRRKKRHLYVEVDRLEAGVPGSDDRYQDFDLRQAIENLSTVNRTTVILRYYEGLKLDEVASVMGENLSTVKTRLYTSLRKLRIELAEPGEVVFRHRDTGGSAVATNE